MQQTPSRKWRPQFDDGPHHRAQIGFVCVANADLTERDMFAMKPDGVGVHFTRVRMPRECTIESLTSMEAVLDDAVSTLMPGRDDVSVLCYNCTSGSVIIGEEQIVAKLAAGRPDVKATTLLTGVIAALRALGAGRLVIGTAYTDDINAEEADYFRSQGFDVLDIQGLDLTTDTQMNRVTPEFLAEFAIALDRPDADAIFLNCGAQPEAVSEL